MVDPTTSRQTDDDGDEEIDVGSDLLPRTLHVFGRAIRTQDLARGAWAVVAIAVVVAVVQTVSSPRAVKRQSPVPATVASDQPSPFDLVLEMAHERQLEGNIRQTSPPGSCASVAVNHSPEGAVLEVLRQMVNGTTVVDAARTLDQFTGLCTLRLRARGPGQVLLTAMIWSPPPHSTPNTIDALELGIETDAGVTIEYAQETTHDGWGVLIGAVGSSSALPHTHDLTTAVQTQSLLW